MARTSLDDLFERFLRPAPTETEIERAARIAAEETAARVSAEIDEVLKSERLANRKRRQKEVKVLLLGQEASGKTTCLKQFLLNFSADVFQEERASWRIIVFLNVIKSFRTIFNALSLEYESFPQQPSSPSDDKLLIRVGGVHDGRDASFAEIKMRLSPLLSIEAQLVRKLNMGEEAEDAAAGIIRSWPATKAEELTVRGGSWKKSFQRKQHDGATASGPKQLDSGIDWEDREDPGVIFNACRKEMIALWDSPQVRDTLQKQKVDLADSGGFFLDDLERITARRYIPCDDDILRARLKTVGAAEHSFTMTTGPEKGTVWKIYDVGGARNQRLTWAPFFDDVDAVMFLAPISAFDQTLSEAQNVNRLHDSLTLWMELCKNKILAKVPLILFLNKSDLLKKKLESGMQLKDFVPSYNDRPNTYPAVTKYLASKFEYFKKHQPNPTRDIYSYLTQLTDRESMIAVILSVRETILNLHFKQTNRL
ncbi:hypothetical protein FRB93_004778 [Tulasnella sp. JGI-2019a]|nr:hypothetical protein FRB93_004778 [Tulasnella sp. JGI-2019a]